MGQRSLRWACHWKLWTVRTEFILFVLVFNPLKSYSLGTAEFLTISYDCIIIFTFFRGDLDGIWPLPQTAWGEVYPGQEDSSPPSNCGFANPRPPCTAATDLHCKQIITNQTGGVLCSKGVCWCWSIWIWLSALLFKFVLSMLLQCLSNTASAMYVIIIGYSITDDMVCTEYKSSHPVKYSC